ncbi:D-aminoacylase [Aureibaculum sp. 2210JD6-5]|uniref:N-acyl-D-amino-acid deacylase family protein n=1 Tax=Aureibaculum sp. 2210JD6-5 TaxID=3103957 RepID=UPI002AAE317D|nr:D-aminoacylase [Aureibaculum sp. 2210JD6-5]MDY7396821.1 D-aminoacylase [Aureibaculum sp. 2210JD6-5]
MKRISYKIISQKTPYLLLLFAVLFVFSSCSKNKSVHYEIVLKNSNINRGDGNPSTIMDIGINADTIAFIGEINIKNANSVIDVTGLTVAPGYIDMHAHLDPIFKHPDAKSALTQGVTTSLGGPDGGGFWPFGSRLDSISNLPLGMNVAYLVGHNQIRKAVMQMDNRDPTIEELAQMKAMVSQAMDDGAFGISTGLKYLPGAFSKVEEVIELSKSASEKGGIYTSHLREEGLGLIEGVSEAIQIGEKANIPIVLTHHKAIGKPVWGFSKKTLKMVDSARALGIDVMIDQYPYNASYTSISVLIPAWARAGGQSEFVKRTENKKLKDSILAGIEFNILNDRGGGDLNRVQLAKTPWDETLSGKTLKFWAEREKLEPNAKNGALLVLKAQLTGGGTAIYHAMDEKDIQRIMQHPQTMFGSDGRLTTPEDSGWPHPRWYGTFPRVLGHYVRELKVLDLPTALKKMTSMPADRLGLTKRGRLKVGNYADITIFDPETVIDKSIYTDPHHFSEGIKYVFVNGVLTINDGVLLENRGGKLLRK